MRAFGKMPRFQMRLQTEEAKQENQLRRQLDTVLKQKRLNRNELAEVDEFRWMRRREDEWKAIARAQQQKETKKYKTELRAFLGEAEDRCTCYKFKHWEGLWREDRAKATRLRQQGWHIVGVCELLDYDGPPNEMGVSKSTRLRWLELLDGRLRERGEARHAVCGFIAEDDLEFALELEQQFYEVDESCEGINPVWKKLAAWVPSLLARYSLAVAEGDGFFCMTAGDKETYLVAPRFCPRPAHDVMDMEQYAFLLRSHGVLYDWQFRAKPACMHGGWLTKTSSTSGARSPGPPPRRRDLRRDGGPVVEIYDGTAVPS